MKKAKSVRIVNDYTQQVIFDGNLADYKQFCRDRLNYYPMFAFGNWRTVDKQEPVTFHFYDYE